MSELDSYERKEQVKSGIKSAAKALWNKWRNRNAADKIKSLVQAVAATTVVGGLAVGGAIGYNQLADNSTSIMALQAQNTSIQADIPRIESDVTEAQRSAEEARALAEGTSADVDAVAAANNENSQRIEEVATTIEKDSEENAARISAVENDLAEGKFDSAEAKQEAKAALDQAAKNQTALSEQAGRIDGVAAQVTDLASKEQANAKAAADAKGAADGAVATANDAVSQARSASNTAAEAVSAATEAKETADQALALAQAATARLPVILSITELENQNATVTVGTVPSVTYSFGSASFDGTSRYLFSFSWLRSGFATSCTGGVLLDGSPTDTQGNPYPPITTGTPIDDYTSYNFITRASLVVPPAGSHALTFLVNEGSCAYSDVTLTIMKVG